MKKRIVPGRILASFAYGSQAVYDFLHENPSVAMMDCAFVNVLFFFILLFKHFLLSIFLFYFSNFYSFLFLFLKLIIRKKESKHHRSQSKSSCN